MPCYTQREVTVKMEASEPAILEAGLKAAGFQVRTTPTGLYVQNRQGVAAHIRSGQITTQENTSSIINEIKRAYSGEVVRVAAKRFGWKLSATSDANTVRAARRF